MSQGKAYASGLSVKLRRRKFISWYFPELVAFFTEKEQWCLYCSAREREDEQETDVGVNSVSPQ